MMWDGALCSMRETWRSEPYHAPIETRNRFQALAAQYDEQETTTDESDEGSAENDEDSSGNTGARKRWADLRTLREVVPQGVKNLGEQAWEEIEMMVDSGATETVVSENTLKNIETTQETRTRGE